MTVDRETHLLSGAYALDALTPQEARAVEIAMRDSEELRGEVVGLVDTAVALGLALQPVAPPPAMRASLLAAIEDVPQLPAEQAVEPEPVAAPAQPLLAVGSHLAPRRRRRLMRRPAVLLAAAGLAVLLFGGGVLVQRAMIEPQLEYSRVVAAADAETATHELRGGGVMTVAWSKSEGATAVSLKGVTVPSGKVLQLWNVRDGAVSSAGLYEPDQDAQGELIHRLPAPGEQLAVSVEPAGGSKQPTTLPLVSLPLEA